MRRSRRGHAPSGHVPLELRREPLPGFRNPSRHVAPLFRYRVRSTREDSRAARSDCEHTAASASAPGPWSPSPSPGTVRSPTRAPSPKPESSSLVAASIAYSRSRLTFQSSSWKPHGARQSPVHHNPDMRLPRRAPGPDPPPSDASTANLPARSDAGRRSPSPGTVHRLNVPRGIAECTPLELNYRVVVDIINRVKINTNVKKKSEGEDTPPRPWGAEWQRLAGRRREGGEQNREGDEVRGRAPTLRSRHLMKPSRPVPLWRTVTRLDKSTTPRARSSVPGGRSRWTGLAWRTCCWRRSPDG